MSEIKTIKAENNVRGRRAYTASLFENSNGELYSPLIPYDKPKNPR